MNIRPYVLYRRTCENSMPIRWDKPVRRDRTSQRQWSKGSSPPINNCHRKAGIFLLSQQKLLGTYKDDIKRGKISIEREYNGAQFPSKRFLATQSKLCWVPQKRFRLLPNRTTPNFPYQFKQIITSRIQALSPCHTQPSLCELSGVRNSLIKKKRQAIGLPSRLEI